MKLIQYISYSHTRLDYSQLNDKSISERHKESKISDDLNIR